MDAKQLYLLCVSKNGLNEGEVTQLSTQDKAMLEKIGEKYWLKSSERSKFKVVLTGGVFDILHIGHMLTLQKAKEHGDLLVAVVTTDKRVQEVKKRNPVHKADYRRTMVLSIKWVDLAIIGSEKIMDTFERVKPDLVVFGYDQQPFKLPEPCKSVHLKDVKADEDFAKTSKIIRELGL